MIPAHLLIHEDSSNRSLDPYEGPQGVEIALKFIETSWNALKSMRNIGCPIQQAYIHLDPVMQIGPSCGLAAMSMISTLTPRRLPILEIFKHAKDQGYTKYGEMFSVNNMKSLINASPLSIWFDAVIYSGGILPRKKQIIAAMCKGALILIPYDADKNYAPVCLMGHKAHWAVLCGIIDDSKNCVVVARQGKSKYVSLWLLDELDRSNNNLMECDPERAKCGFVISDLSLELAGKYIVLNPKSQSKDVHILTNII